MDPSNEKLLDLIRLTDRSLAHIDSATLQQLVAEDVELRAKMERLELVLHASESIGKEALWHDLDLSDAEQTAEIMDASRALEMSTSSEFVGSIDELQSLAPMNDDSVSRSTMESAARSLANAVAQELARAKQRTVDSVDRETAGASRDPDLASNVAPAFNGNAVQLQIVDRSPRRLQRTRFRRYYLWPAVVGVAVAIAVFLMSISTQRRAPNPSSPVPAPLDVVVDTPEPSIETPDELPPEPEPMPREVPQIAMEPPVEEATEPLVVEDTSPPRRPRMPEVGRPDVPQKLKWERVSGIVASQDEGSDSWYAVQAGSSSSTIAAGDYQQFRTLGNSWGEARTESGIRVVLGPDAVARVAISIGAALKVQLDIERGKVSVGDLPASAQVVIKHANEHSEWLVSNQETELAFDLQGASSELQLVQGGIQSDGHTFTGPAKVSFEQGGWVAGRLTRRAPWLARPPALSPIERQFAIIAAEGGDLVSELLANRPGMNDFQARAAAMWGLSLDPARTVPMALASPFAGQRAAAAQWLVDPANELAALRPVLAQLQPLLKRSQCNVPRWIAAVRGDMPLSKALAHNMLLGLRPAEPMFVREMALSALMKLTGRTFPLYDLRNPTRQGITQITRTVQPWIDQLP